MKLNGREFKVVPRTRRQREAIYETHKWNEVQYSQELIGILAEGAKSPVAHQLVPSLIEETKKAIAERGLKVDHDLLLASLQPLDSLGALTEEWLLSLTENEYKKLEWEVGTVNQTVINPLAVLREVLPSELKLTEVQSKRCFEIIRKVASGEFELQVFRDGSPEKNANG